MACKKHVQRKRKECPDCQAELEALTKNEQKKTTDKAETKSPQQEKVKTKTNKAKGKVLEKPKEIQVPIAESSELKKEYVIPKEEKERIKVAVEAYVKEVLDKKLLEAKHFIAQVLAVEYEHLYVNDENLTIQLQKRLSEKEGWEIVKHSYPLAKYGMISQDYTTFKRIKKATNVIKPNFDDNEIIKKYGGRLKGK